MTNSGSSSRLSSRLKSAVGGSGSDDRGRSREVQEYKDSEEGHEETKEESRGRSGSLRPDRISDRPPRDDRKDERSSSWHEESKNSSEESKYEVLDFETLEEDDSPPSKQVRTM